LALHPFDLATDFHRHRFITQIATNPDLLSRNYTLLTLVVAVMARNYQLSLCMGKLYVVRCLCNPTDNATGRSRASYKVFFFLLPVTVPENQEHMIYSCGALWILHILCRHTRHFPGMFFFYFIHHSTPCHRFPSTCIFLGLTSKLSPPST